MNKSDLAFSFFIGGVGQMIYGIVVGNDLLAISLVTLLFFGCSLYLKLNAIQDKIEQQNFTEVGMK